MREKIELPSALQFLSWVQDSSPTRYNKAAWLTCAFSDDVWICNFNGTPIELDFRIILPNGKCLSKDYPKTTEIFKTWLCVQPHPDATGGRVNSSITIFHKVSEVFRIIDFLIINDSRYRILENGFAATTAQDLRSILAEVASSARSMDSVYQWKSCLTRFAVKCILEVSDDMFAEVIRTCPQIVEIDVPEEDRTLALTSAQLIRFRVWLRWKNFYNHSSSTEYKYSPSIVRLVEELYPSTIWAKHTSFSSPTELSYDSIERYQREFDAVPIRTANDDNINPNRFDQLRSAIKSIGLLSTIGHNVPAQSVAEFLSHGRTPTVKIKSQGRFLTLPQEIVLSNLRKSIEFVMDYGNDLVDGYVQIAKESAKLRLNVPDFCNKFGVSPFISEKLRNLGVKTWILGQTMSMSEANPAKDQNMRASADEFFNRFRAGEGLFDLLQVLFGSILITVGVLTARRQAELLDLNAENCLDETRNYLIFLNRKTGIDGMRQQELRPIPSIAVKMIGVLVRLQDKLKLEGIIPASTHLFSTPHRSNCGLGKVSATQYNRALDRTCDYFSTELDAKNRRYYFRQHLLRRFFATLFFWGKAFGGMDTLRWFLGHTDVQHLYHYITESLDGSVLRWSKAMYVSEGLKEQKSDFDEIAFLLERRFQTRDFKLLDAEELALYVEMLLDEGSITVEPIFFKLGILQDFKILVKVSGRNSND